jgi:hypothetical protein
MQVAEFDLLRAIGERFLTVRINDTRTSWRIRDAVGTHFLCGTLLTDYQQY